jgi:hypothetical protein
MIGMKKMRKKSEKAQNVNVDQDKSDGRECIRIYQGCSRRVDRMSG